MHTLFEKEIINSNHEYYIPQLSNSIENFYLLNADLNRIPSSTADMLLVFQRLFDKALKNDFTSLSIINYMHNNLTDESKAKRKVTARDIEDFIADLFEGTVTDEESRQNLTSTIDIVDSYISSNYREKCDIQFNNSYKLSIKSFISDNKEINCGSFAREALFKDIVENYGGERKNGLGSKGQFLDLFEKIKDNGKWTDFTNRFTYMTNNIFKDDLLIFIKGGNNVDIYLVDSEKFRNTLISAVSSGPKFAVSVLNRYEGNSIRIERDIFLSPKISTHIGLNFNKTNENALNKIDVELQKLKDVTLNFISNDTASLNNYSQLISTFNSSYQNTISDLLSLKSMTLSSDALITSFHQNVLNLYSSNKLSIIDMKKKKRGNSYSIVREL
uniref:Cac8I n=1 Tax=Clostridium acetobutylicum TaxID=1488 RepID=F1KC40_CLOAT|nr:Cac8I [Clostridium acetobutylicum]